MNLTKKTLIKAAAGIFFAFILLAILTAAPAGGKTYEVKPEVTVGIEPYKSDVVRIVDAYERLMDRYISIVDQDMNRAVGTLDSIENKLTMINARLERIERALDIPQPGDITKE